MNGILRYAQRRSHKAPARVGVGGARGLFLPKQGDSPRRISWSARISSRGRDGVKMCEYVYLGS